MNWKWPEPFRKWKGALGKYQAVLLVVAVGALLLLLPAGGGDGAARSQEDEAAADMFDLEAFEQRLETTLSQIQGVGKVRVVLTLDGGSRRILAQDVEREGDGGSSTAVVTVGGGSAGQEAVPLQTMAPDFRGALVVCSGGGEPQIQLQIMQAVSALTGLSSNRISVCEGST